MGECCQWKADGQCSRGDSCSFSHEPAFGNEREAQKRKVQQCSPAPYSKAKTDDGQIQIQATEGKALQTKGAEFRADTENVITRHVITGMLPCQNYKSETGFIPGNRCYFRHVEAEEKPNEKSKKGGAKGSVALLKKSIQLGCASEGTRPRKSFHGNLPRFFDTRGANQCVTAITICWAEYRS